MALAGGNVHFYPSVWLAICYSTPKKVCEGLIYLFYLWVKYVGNYQHDLRKNAASLGTMEPIWLEKCVFVKKNWRISYLVMFGAEISTSMLKIKNFPLLLCKKWMIQRFAKSSTSITDWLTGPHFALFWSLHNKLSRQTSKQPNMGQSKYHALERGSF